MSEPTTNYSDDWLTIYQGDARAVMAELPAESVHCVVTSPPYWGLRDYGTATWDGATRLDSQLGHEPTPEAYVAAMVDVFREVRRVLRDDGTLWLNLGDSYASSGGERTYGSSDNGTGRGPGTKRHDVPSSGLKPKDLVGIPWRVAFALQADGWYLRSDIIWSKPNPMPESVTDRPTKSHEYLFLLAKSARYYFDAEAVRERAESGPSDLRKMAEGKDLRASALTNMGLKRSVGGKQLASAEHSAPSTQRRMGGFNDRWNASEDNGSAPVGHNIRTVWTIATAPYPGAHFATFPPKLVEPCVKAGCPAGGVVLDPFAGTGTVGMVAQQLSRRAVLIDLNAEYLAQCLARNAQTPLGLEVTA